MRLRRSFLDWWVDLGMTAAGLALGLIFLSGSMDAQRTGGPPVHLPFDLTTGLLAAAAVLTFRRAFPLGLMIVLIPVGVLSSTAMGSALAALLGLAIHRPWRTVVPVAGAFGALIAILFGIFGGPHDQKMQAIIGVLLLEAVLVVSGMLVRSQRQLVASLRQQARQAVGEARHLERERLAREMHDVLAHRISLLAVHAGALEYRTGDASAAIIRQCAHDAMEELREVLGMLREPSPGDRPQPTLGDLPRLLAEVREAGAQIELDDRTAADALPARIGRHAYRIVQEALTNARKHAPDAPVRIRLEGAAGGELTIEVRNPVRTPSGLPGSGSGLIGLRERVSLVGGELEHGRVNGDFRLLARLPWAG